MTDRRQKAVWGFRIGLALGALLIVAQSAAAQGEIRRAPLKTTNGAEYHAGATCPPPAETGTHASSLYVCENGDVYSFNGSAWLFAGTAALPVTTGAHKVLADTGVSQGWSARPTIGDLTWPASDGMAGQLLATDGSGALGFVDATTGTSDTQILFNDGGSVGGSSRLTVAFGELNVGSVIGQAGAPSNYDAGTFIYSGTTDGSTGGAYGGLFGKAAIIQGVADVSGTTAEGMVATGSLTSNAVTSTAEAAGVHALVNTDGSADFTSVNGFVGVLGNVVHLGSGTVTNAMALKADQIFALGMGTLTNVYGLYVRDQIGGVNNWAIKTGLGQVAFGDALTVTGAAVTGSDNANPITLTGGSSVDGAAGSITLTPGTASGMGTDGVIILAGGTVQGGSDATWGQLLFGTPTGDDAGNGFVTGGTNGVYGGASVNAAGGSPDNGRGGSAQVLGGSLSGTAGGSLIVVGRSSTDGGAILADAGNGLAGSVAGGALTFTAGTSVDGAAGSITLTAGTASGMGTDGTINLIGTTTIPALACPMGQTAPLSVDDTGAITKGSCS